MRTNKLYIFRGLPGSGKSTEAKKIGCIVLEPQDNWFIQNGKYKWIKEKAHVAENNSILLLQCIMNIGYDVAVAEILPRLEDIYKYIDVAKSFNYNYEVIDLKISPQLSYERNIHNVNFEDIKHYDEIWEDWK